MHYFSKSKTCFFLSKIFAEDPINKAEFYCQSNRSSFLYSDRRFSNMSPSSSSSPLIYECAMYEQERNVTEQMTLHEPRPNIALLSLILLIGTCCIALALKKLRRSVFLGARARRTLSDVGMLISIILMAIVDSVIKAKTGVETPVHI